MILKLTRTIPSSACQSCFFLFFFRLVRKCQMSTINNKKSGREIEEMIANETELKGSRFPAVDCAVVFSLSLFAAYLIPSRVYLCTCVSFSLCFMAWQIKCVLKNGRHAFATCNFRCAFCRS